MAGQDLARKADRILVLGRIVVDVQREIDGSEAELAHLHVGGAIGARALHLLEEVIGDGRAGFVVAREQVQRLALGAPVLHDLRRQLDEVLRHARAGQAPHAHPAQAMVEQMSELVKEARHLNPKLQALAILNAADPQGKDNEEAAEAIKGIEGIDLLPVTIGRRKAFPNVAATGQGITEQTKDRKALQEMKSLIKTLDI